MAQSYEAFQRFAFKTLKSEHVDMDGVAKALPLYNNCSFLPAYKKIESLIKNHIKASNSSRSSKPQPARKVTIAMNTFFFLAFRWFLYEIKDAKTDYTRTGIAVLRDNSPSNPVYANGSVNEYLMYCSMGFDIQTGLAAAVGTPNPGPTESLDIEYNPNDGTDPDLQKKSAGARFQFMKAFNFPGWPSYPGVGLMMNINQVMIHPSLIPTPSHPAWKKQSSVPSINKISSYPYDPLNMKDYFLEPGFRVNQEYVNFYMAIPPDIAIPNTLPDGYTPPNYGSTFDPLYWTTYASDEMSVEISESEYEPLKDILFTIDPYDYDLTNEQVTDWYKNANNNFFKTCYAASGWSNINYILYTRMVNFTTSWLAGEEKTSLDDVRKYIYGIGGGITTPFTRQPGGIVIQKNYLIPDSLMIPHASKYHGILYPQCETVSVFGGCYGVCFS